MIAQQARALDHDPASRVTPGCSSSRRSRPGRSAIPIRARGARSGTATSRCCERCTSRSPTPRRRSKARTACAPRRGRRATDDPRSGAPAGRHPSRPGSARAAPGPRSRTSSRSSCTRTFAATRRRATNTAALVPAADGHGYWLVGCDGSVYHFGPAPRISTRRGARSRATAASSPPSATPGGRGPLVGCRRRHDRDRRRRARAAVRTTAVRADHRAQPRCRGGNGLLGRDRDRRACSPPDPSPTSATSRARIRPRHVVGIAATRSGRGYWLVASDGAVFAFGDARAFGSAPTRRQQPSSAPIVGIAPTADERGYWLVGRDGSVVRLRRRPVPRRRHVATAAVSVQRTPRRTRTDGRDRLDAGSTAQGYWMFGTTGRVVARGAAGSLGGDNNLALLTQ